MKKNLGRVLPRKNEEDKRTRFPLAKWHTEAKRDHIIYSFIQPMRFKEERLDIREASKEKVEEIFSFFFYGVK